MDPLRTVNITLGGMPLQQTWSALYWFDRLFAELCPTGVVELGTGHGGLATVFGMYRPGAVLTLDHADRRSQHAWTLHERLGVRMVVADILGHLENIKWALDRFQAPRLLFCDNGNKQMEFVAAVPHLAPGDIIAVHDAGTEFDPENPTVQRIAVAQGLARWQKDRLDADKTLLAVWVKR